jgi:simple sugar transport system ATP-binding protein
MPPAVEAQGAVPGVPVSTVVEAIAVSKRFGATQALEGVDVAVAAGEVHALVGRNGAGKSTLVGLLTGLLAPDSGEVRFGGEAAPAPSARSEWQARVACVYQQPTVVPRLTVAENLFLNSQPRSRSGWIDWRAMRRAAGDLLGDWGVEVDVDEPAFMLSVEERQLVEIVRALHQGSRFVILDEPTAQLDAQSSERLFDHVRRLKASGVTFLYISHHLPEVFEICDSVTVLLNGRRVLSRRLEGLSRDELVSTIVGDPTAAQGWARAERASTRDDLLLSVRDLELGGEIGPVSFEVRNGECVGLAGQRQSGAMEIARSLVGLAQPTGGEILVAGSRPRLGSPRDAAAAGIGYMPEDRHESGFVATMSVTDNVTMTVLPRLSRWGLVNVRHQRRLAGGLVEALSIRASGDDHLDELSGGNQQKVVMARALATDPSLLVLLHPTAGVDIASKDALFKAIDDASAAGTGTLIVSDELDELRQCDRVLVISGGRLVAEHPVGWRDEQLIAQMEGGA